MTTPPRRTEAQRKRHLDASVVPVERALLERAGVLDGRAADAPGHPELGIGPADARVLRGVAAEFRALAEELHFW